MRTTTNTVGSVLDLYRSELAAVVGTAEATAMMRTIFRETFGWDAAEVELQRHARLSESELLKVYLPLGRLRKGEPLQYVLGHTWFLGMRLLVAPDVLIPRPETEEMVDMIRQQGKDRRRMLDVGTGSGCIAVGLKASYPNSEVFGMDISERTLAVARQNGTTQGLSITWLQSDVLAAATEFPGTLDLVVSNPPYVPRTEAHGMAPQVIDHEPHLALFVDDAEPLLFYQRIADKAFRALKQGGELWFEGHYQHAGAVGELLTGLNYRNVQVLPDMSGTPRFIRAVR